MEVREELVHGTKYEAGGAEKPRIVVKLAYFAVRIDGGLEHPERGGPDRDHRSPVGPGRVDPRRRIGIDLAIFGMHPVLADIFDRHRQERPGADMERDRRDFHTRRPQCRHERGREVQPRRRRRNRPLPFREHRLVVVRIPVVGSIATLDIGR